VGKNSPQLKNFRFKTSEIRNFSPIELSALKGIYGFYMEGDKLYGTVFTTSFDKEAGIISFESVPPDENLSIVVTNHAFKYISKFYCTLKTKSTSNSLRFVEGKKDSITSLLRASQLKLARFNDSYQIL
jgi:hypothetical protein